MVTASVVIFGPRFLGVPKWWRIASRHGKSMGTFLSDECELNCSRLNLVRLREPLRRMEFPRSHLSDHALQRLQERFKISSAELLRLLNADLGKKIGVSVRTHLIHRLLWSQVDRSLLVAIQDAITGTLLAVLTVEMYQREYEANLTERRLRHVVNQMVHAGYAPVEMWEPVDPNQFVTIYARLTSSEHLVALGRYRGEIASVDLSTLGKESEFWAWLVRGLRERGHNIETLEFVTGKFSGGDHQQIPYALAGDA